MEINEDEDRNKDRLGLNSVIRCFVDLGNSGGQF